MLKKLSESEYRELLAYLQLTGHHRLRQWRDETLAYNTYLKAISIGVKAKYESYLPPSIPKKIKEQTPEELEANLRLAMNVAMGMTKKPK